MAPGILIDLCYRTPLPKLCISTLSAVHNTLIQQSWASFEGGWGAVAPSKEKEKKEKKRKKRKKEEKRKKKMKGTMNNVKLLGLFFPIVE